MKKTSKTLLGNILKSKCPTCHTGYLFSNKNPYNLGKIFKMNDFCSNCHQNFSPEPRFYDGAMYVSYAFSVIIVATVFVSFTTIYEDAPLIPMILTTVGSAVLLSPISFRLSRSVWIHLFFTKKREKVNISESKKQEL